MKKYIVTIVLFCSFWVVNAQTVKIGSTSYGTITEAITAANNGDVIDITGVHTEPISISKSITLRGTDPTTDIIQAAASPLSDGTGSRVISLNEGNFNITIENLGIKNGNVNGNGGGIFVDKVSGSVTLTNLIVENNYASSNGGAIGLSGTNATITSCIIQNNTSTQDGGGILAAPHNASAINSVIDIKQTLINNNTGRNGGALFINGNKDFGNDYTIDVNLENTTVSNNNATSASGGNGGGAIFSASQPLTSNTSQGNVSLKLVHTTLVNNTHASLVKSGIQFGNAKVSNFSAYNSIIVATDISDENDPNKDKKAINFANSNTTDIVNCILGGLQNIGSLTSLLDDNAKNNQRGKFPTFAGLTTLTDEGGNTQVFAFAEGSNADDFCTATTGLSLPTVDQRGYSREGTPDVGAFEFGGTLSLKNNSLYKVSIYPNPAQNIIKISGIDNINTINIYSVLGKLEQRGKNSNSIDVSNLSKGIYILQIVKDSETIEKKFIKI